jgi:hypothetical protein
MATPRCLRKLRIGSVTINSKGLWVPHYRSCIYGRAGILSKGSDRWLERRS